MSRSSPPRPTTWTIACAGKAWPPSAGTAAPLDVPAARDWLAARVVGQPEAVDLDTDLPATVTAGLARPNRPVASLLFVGPTGVGKTELAKALAEFLFGSADRLIRCDMSEYADPVAVRRLVGSGHGEGLLTAAVREQPFRVLLLDEIDKASLEVFDALLGLLDEGRLTDPYGRVTEFRSAVVRMTSNLGAGLGRPAGFGADPGPRPREATRAFFRPEFFNRLDAVVGFDPLGPSAVARIARRGLAAGARRDGLAGLTLTWTDALVDHLAEVGFDARFGARPL